MGGISVEAWLELIILAGITGAVGQSARVIVGIKKVNDTATATNQQVSTLIDPSRLLISLLIGFVAGALSVMIMHPDIANLTPQTILGFAAAGYAGADFIEGIMNKTQPQSSSPAAAVPPA